ncbi:MAG: phosphopantothenoylcysteine decarboxylase [Planctomycetota bacterium]|nr:phosphopantothenoylcysteine decarboxylase [Planctomycetota bacterium]
MATKRKRPLNLVVTAGPTREYIDPVRYLSNESSGKMGFAIATEAVKRGHKVTLIAGPVHLETPAGVNRVDVISARDMLAAMKTAFRDGDGLIMAAAVADYRPARKLKGKWKKDPSKKGGGVDLPLVENPDLLATVGARKGSRCIMGFALETSNGMRNALGKMQRKNADFIALNGASALNANTTSVTLIGRDGSTQEMLEKSKKYVARRLVMAVEGWRAHA